MAAKTIADWAALLTPVRIAIDAGERVICLDPSSSCTGAAVLDFKGPAPSLLHAARLQGKPVSGPPYQRVDQMVDQVLALIGTYGVTTGILEVTTGKTSGRHGGAGAGLAIYGVAVGALRQALRQALGPYKVCGIHENDWTTRTSKLQRWAACRAQYPSHAQVWADDDGKYDASDAAYLAGWCRDMVTWSRNADAAARSKAGG